MTLSPKENFHGAASSWSERPASAARHLAASSSKVARAAAREDGGAEGGDRRDVHGQLAERRGFGVRLEVGLVFRDASEDAAGHGDLHVVVLKENISDGHVVPL
jgi:hypothetical protein